MDVVLLAAILTGDDRHAPLDSTGDPSIKGLTASRRTGRNRGYTRWTSSAR